MPSMQPLPRLSLAALACTYGLGGGPGGAAAAAAAEAGAGAGAGAGGDPSSSEEWDPYVFDPSSFSGAPYGGYARAARGRLAALPLRLVGGAGFEDWAGGGAGGDSSAASSSPHFRLADADGSPFVCRVYREDELDPHSTIGSMFDPPVLREVYPGLDGAEGEEEEEDAKVAEEWIQDSDSHPSTPLVISRDDVPERLEALEGVCAQIQQGWWSYEWCYGDEVGRKAGVRQFHVETHPKPQTVVNPDGTTELQIVRQPEVQKVSSIGKLRASRRVDLREMTPEQLPKGREVTYGDHGDGKAGMVQVTDVYEDGDWCEEHGVHRTTEVQIRCCPEETEAHGERTQLLRVHEVEKAPCTYAALVCAPILCTDSFERLLDERIDAGSAKEGTGKHKQRLNLKMTRTGTKRRRKKTESVRDILDRILGKMCLQKNAGWWTYELCHGKIAREFHGTNVLDANTGASRLVIEEEHLIGRYHAEEHEAYPDVEEALHVVNATADDESEAEGDGSSGRTGREGGRKKDAAAVGGLAAVSPPSDAGGNGSVFVQEYIDGLACNDSDVADSVIRGNNVVGGGIQRSVTIRYSCGKKYELVRVNEDTTCHYVFDVTVPALCGHPLFKAEMARTQVVKCLPVE